MTELADALTRAVIELSARVRVLEKALSKAPIGEYIPKRDIPKVHQFLIDASVLFGIPVEVMLTKSRVQVLAHARQWVMYEASMVGISTTKIGRQMGGLDHTTVMHGIKREQARRIGGKVAPTLVSPAKPVHKKV